MEERPIQTAVPDDQKLVTELQTQLVNSVILQSSPDPSVLIALNLAEALDPHVKMQLIEKIKETVVEKNTKDDYGTLKTTYYQLALDILALCVENSLDVEDASVILAKAALANELEFGGYFSVDYGLHQVPVSSGVPCHKCYPRLTKRAMETLIPQAATYLYTGAVASLALTCVSEMSKIQQSEFVTVIEEALTKITKQILGEQHSNGIIGNIYSTGLAMQALSVTSKFYNPGAWDRVKTTKEVLKEISLGAFNIPAAAAQILPSLVGKTYLDVRDGCGSTITVQYTISNSIVGPSFSYSITVNVPKGSVLLTVLNAAQSAKPNEFSFQTEETSWGPMVVSIHNVQASTNEKTYWQFLSGKKPLDQGVGSYKPVDGEHIRAIFSRY
uniref:Uncharacterized protein n=1 Tax=Sphaerodactylus townsendi TaxID=933632 RepID=A0ACB8G3P8_9SAUR